MKFYVILDPDLDRGAGYLASCLGLGACNAWGKSKDEALTTIQHHIKLVLTDMSFGIRPIPKQGDLDTEADTLVLLPNQELREVEVNITVH